MLFLKKQDFLPQTTGLTLGQSLQKSFTREHYLESLELRLTAVVSGAIATATADGLLGLLKSVTFNVADGSEPRNVVNAVSGRGLLEYAYVSNGLLDRNTMAAKDATAAATYILTYPIFFCPPQISDPVGSAFLLPLPRYNQDPVLTIQLASQADVDSNGTPTFACSSITLDVVINRRFVNRTDFETVNHDFSEAVVSYASSLANQRYELPTPGSFTMLMLRGYTSATARGDVSMSGGEFRLQLLNNVVRRFRLLDLQTEMDFSCFPNAPAQYFTGLYPLDFLTDRVGADVGELGSLLDASMLAGIGGKLELMQDIAGGSNVTMKYLMHRVYGDLSKYKIGQAKAA